jgi:hypothetical protein
MCVVLCVSVCAPMHVYTYVVCCLCRHLSMCVVCELYIC